MVRPSSWLFDGARAATLLALAALPFHELAWRVGPVGVRPVETMLALAVGLVILGLTASLIRGDGRVVRQRLAGGPVDLEVAVVLVLGLLALAAFPGPGESGRVYRLVLFESALAYFLVTRLLPGPIGAYRCVVAVVLGAVAASVLGFVQLATDANLIRAEGVLRIRAAYGSPNNLALYLDRALPLAAAMALLGGAGAGRLGWITSFLIIGVGQLLTYSIGGWLASGAALAVVALGSRHRRALLGGLATIGLVGVAAIFALRPERIFSHLDPGAASTSSLRVLLWESAVTMLRDHPLLGVGLDNFLYLYSPEHSVAPYMNPAAWREPNLSHPHNLLLDWWLSLGLAGALTLLWLLVRVAPRLVRRAWRSTTNGGDARAIAIGATGALVATVLHGAMDNSFFLPDLAILWWLTFALLAAVADRPSVAADQAATPPRR